MDDRLLNATEAAAFLGLSVKHVRRLASDGDLPSVKIRSSLRFDPGDLHDFVGRCRRPATAD